MPNSSILLGMHNKFSTIFAKKNLQVLSLGAMAIIGSFSLGIQTAGDIQPISLIEAGSVQTRGDIDGNGVVDIQDVIVILEIANGYAEATPDQLRADPNGDGRLTVDDAIRILTDIRNQ